MKTLLKFAIVIGTGVLAYNVGEKYGTYNAITSVCKHIDKHFPDFIAEIKKGPTIVFDGPFNKYRFDFEKT